MEQMLASWPHLSSYISAGWAELIEEILKTRSYTSENALPSCTSTGTEFLMEVSAAQLYESDGAVMGFSLSFTDITAQTRIFQQLRTSEKQYRNLLERAAMGILVVEPHTGVVIDINPYLLKLLGFDQSDFFEGLPHFLGGKDASSDWRTLFKKLSQNESGLIEMQLKTKSGDLVPIEASMSETVFGDTIRALLIFIRDISQRKIGEEALHKSRAMLLEAQQINMLGTWEWDPVKREGL